MRAMDPLDGNAIGGDLLELLGEEMTDARGRCRDCGTSSMVGELRVYARAPGAVGRCRTCGEVVIVLARVRGERQVNMDAFELATPPGRSV